MGHQQVPLLHILIGLSAVALYKKLILDVDAIASVSKSCTILASKLVGARMLTTLGTLEELLVQDIS